MLTTQDPNRLISASTSFSLGITALAVALLVALVPAGAVAKGNSSGKRGQITIKPLIDGGIPVGAKPRISIRVAQVGPRKPLVSKRLQVKGARTTRVKNLPLGSYRIVGLPFSVPDAAFSPKRPLNLKLTKKKPSKRVVLVFRRDGAGPSGGSTIKFNLKGAIGLLNTEAAGRGSSERSAATSNLMALLPNGELKAAIEGGSQANPPQVRSFSIAPDGAVYLFFEIPGIELASTTPSNASFGCTLIKVDPSSGSASCVDSEVAVVQVFASLFSFRFEPVEFDRSGAVYYMGYRTSGGESRIVLRKKTPEGVITDLLPPSDSSINDFEVSAAGSVLMSATRLRVVTPQGVLKDLTFPGSDPWGWWTQGGIRQFPDGRVFIYRTGLWEGLFSYNDLEAGMDPTPWIGPASTNPQNSVESFCSGLGASANIDFPRYCTGNLGPSIGREKVVLSGNRVFDAHSGGEVVQVFPQFRGIRTRLDKVTAAAGAGNQIILGGSEGPSHLTLGIDANSGAETVLIPSQEAIEIYNLQYSPSAGKLFFDGLRTSNNSYVFGSVRPNGGELSVENASTGRWKEFEVFG